MDQTIDPLKLPLCHVITSGGQIRSDPKSASKVRLGLAGNVTRNIDRKRGIWLN
jgi:hypothetical protein